MIRISCRQALSCSLASLLVAVAAPIATADVLWNEFDQIDISGDRFNPTMVTVGAGTHSLVATSQAGDREYITITIPAGFSLTRIDHVSYDFISDTLAFMGVQVGPIITLPPNTPSPAGLLGWTHFGVNTVGQDVLDNLGNGPGATGFTPPLPAGTYAFWIQQIGGVCEYQLDFVVVESSCVADWDRSGAVTSQDFFEFITDFFMDAADVNGDGFTSSQDFFDFLSAFFVGC